MLNIRLPRELEARLDLLAKQEGLTKSTIARETLQETSLDYEKTRHPYDLGKLEIRLITHLQFLILWTCY